MRPSDGACLLPLLMTAATPTALLGGLASKLAEQMTAPDTARDQTGCGHKKGSQITATQDDCAALMWN